MALGRLEEVNLREVWKSEPYDFTPWLAEPENLQFLAESLELPGLELVRTEHPVETFSADIVCKIVDTDQFVLIENQLEKTDHVHVGQILTYAAKFDARVVVWIAQKFTEAHRAALDWLNLISDDQYGFFGVEVRAVRIGNSDVAPLFNVVAKPNEWTKPERVAAVKQDALTDWHLQNIEFWNAMDAALQGRGLVQRRVKKEVRGSNFWIPLSSDGSVYIVCYRALSGKPRVGCYIGIYGTQMPHYAAALRAVDLTACDPAILAGNWTLNNKETVDSFNLPATVIDEKSDLSITEHLVDQVNLLSSAFLQPVAAAQANKNQAT
jgi:hypothetical protein